MGKRGFAAFWLCLMSMLAVAADAPPYGRFVGPVDTRWLIDGRRMELLSDFKYVDPGGVEWDAPKGSVVDGASIPWIAWSAVGGPYEGKYRAASVIHDVACDRKKRPWELVHLAFYWAMLAGGVDGKRAKVMYAAVYFFGPRWPLEKVAVVAPEQVSEQLRALKTELAAAGTVELRVRDNYIEGVGATGRLEKLPTGMKEVVAWVDARPNTVTPDDLENLKRSIEAQDLSLEQIRAAGAAR